MNCNHLENAVKAAGKGQNPEFLCAQKVHTKGFLESHTGTLPLALAPSTSTFLFSILALKLLYSPGQL